MQLRDNIECPKCGNADKEQIIVQTKIGGQTRLPRSPNSREERFDGWKCLKCDHRWNDQ